MIGHTNATPTTPGVIDVPQFPIFSPLISQLQTGGSKISDAVASLLPAWGSRRQSSATAAIESHILEEEEEEEEEEMPVHVVTQSTSSPVNLVDDNLTAMFQKITFEDKPGTEGLCRIQVSNNGRL